MGYLFDTLGNLKSRADANQKTSESFAYDSLNRLTGATLSGQVGATPFQDPRTYAYDSIGNLTSKSDRGAYSYGAGSAGPHAVTYTAGVSGGRGAATYTYDANGNQLTGDGRTLSYTSFNVPYQITQGTNTTRFTFDPDHARTSQTETTNGVTKTTYYLHPRLDEGAHVEISVTGSLVEYTCFIYAGNKLIAQYHTRNDSSPAQLRYFHTDHLGSIDTVTDETGKVVERMSYDPHGKRRYPNGQSDPSTSLAGLTTDYGFSSHEHLDGVGLIHMNGRVYDPSLGRFLSADPTIQYPESTQNYNRYSYVDNNPLSYTDPSGFGFFSSLFRAIGNVFRAIRQNFRAILAIGVAFIPGINAIAAGFIGGLISGGDLKSGIIGAFTAGLFQGVGALGEAYNLAPGGLAKVLLHGAVGGISSELQGGSFQSGFLAGGFTQAFAPGVSQINHSHVGIDIGRTIAAAVVGGTASVLGGGKFQNGAITGAFSRLFNDDAAHSKSASTTGDELKTFGRGILSFFKSIGALVTHAGNYYGGLACSGFSEACNSTYETARDDAGRIGGALYDYYHDPEIARQVDSLNRSGSQAVFSSPQLQDRIGGRAMTATIVGSMGIPGKALSIMALGGGVLQASQRLGDQFTLKSGIEGALFGE